MAIVAIIGRPNVGKSTLFNRLTGKRQALVDDTPGVTRDRRRGEGGIGPLRFEVMDTPGLEEAAAESLEALMTQQSLTAIEEADVLLFVIDAREGITPQDKHFSQFARKSGKPVVLAANKAEARDTEGGYTEAFALGFGEPVAISAEHGLGMAELYEALAPHLESGEIPGEDSATGKPVRIAIVGRPNVGKSSLINKILGEERLLTGPYAGMTRDAITVPFQHAGTDLLLVDTAGMRRKARIDAKLERMSVKETTTALRYTEVAILVIDATMPLERQDNAIAGLIEREGRACVLALNKWDLVQAGDRKAVLAEVCAKAAEVMPGLKGLPVVTVSAQSGQGLAKLLDEALNVHARWNKRISTGELNRWLEAMLEQHTPPLVKGRRYKIRYITQNKARPPTFVLFVNQKEGPEAYLRYLANGLRDTFGFAGAPVRLVPRTGKNPYAGEK